MSFYGVRFGFNVHAQPVNRKKQQAQNALPFGCRILAIMSPSSMGTTEHDQFIRSSLAFLKEESIEDRKPRDGFFNALNFEDLKGTPKNGNPDGWGIVDYIKTKLFHKKDLRDTRPAYEGTSFDKAVAAVVKDKPNIVMAHVRNASDKKSVENINNTHPFTHKNWGFIHNGFVDIKASSQIQGKLNEFKERYGFQPKGKTDTEEAFYYVLGRMKESGVDIDAKQVDLDKAMRTFAQAVDELQSQAKPTYKKLFGRVMDVEGCVKEDPACNFVMTNGKQMLVYRNSNKLYLGRCKMTDGRSEYVISSETFEDLENNITIKWFTIPQNHVIAMAPDDEGKTIPALYPLEYLLAEE